MSKYCMRCESLESRLIDSNCTADELREDALSVIGKMVLSSSIKRMRLLSDFVNKWCST